MVYAERVTLHEKYIERLKALAATAGKPLGPLAQIAADKRPPQYSELSPQSQWDVDKKLGLLDWGGGWET